MVRRSKIRAVALILALATFAGVSILCAPAASAAVQPGDLTFSIGFGEATTPNDNAYASSETLNIAIQFHKTKSSSFRGSAGFMTLDGREPVSPAAGPRDADILFVDGNYIYTFPFAMVRPYLTAGVGFYSVRLIDNLDTPQSLEFGANWGFGLGIQLSRNFEFGGEILYSYITGEISSPVRTITIGISLHF